MTGKELIKLLQKDGWKLDRIKGSHHQMTKNGKVITIPVHSNSDIKKGLLEDILKKTGLK